MGLAIRCGSESCCKGFHYTLDIGAGQLGIRKTLAINKVLKAMALMV